MTQPLPKIIPVNELKNTAKIIQTCEESTVPIVITKNGYGKAVIMSIDLYEELFAKIQAANLINTALDEIDSGEPLIDGEVFFNQMKAKYDKQL